MTNVSGNLPDGMKPHESDPKPQPVWTGLVSGTVKVHDAVHLGLWEQCANEVDALELAQTKLLGLARQRNPGLDCEAGDDFKAEPD